MQVTFKSSADSYVDSTLALQKHIQRAMGLTLRAQLLWSLGFGLLIVAPLLVAGAYVLQQVSGMTEQLIELGFLLVAVGSLCWFTYWHRTRFVRRLAQLNSPMFGATKVEVRDDAFVVTGPKNRMEFAWDSVGDPSLTDDALQVGFYSYTVIRIPRSAFSSEAELNDFIRIIESRRRQDASG